MVSKRIGVDLATVIVFTAVAVGLSFAPQLSFGWHIGLAIIGATAGLFYGERVWLWTWLMALIEAARILIAQDREPEHFVVPIITMVELWPGSRASGLPQPDYIEIHLRWQSRYFRHVMLTRIRGTLQVGSAITKADLPSIIRDVNIKAVSDTAPSPLRVQISGAPLDAVNNVRQAEKGLGIDLGLEIFGELNGHERHFKSPPFRAIWTG